MTMTTIERLCAVEDCMAPIIGRRADAKYCSDKCSRRIHGREHSSRNASDLKEYRRAYYTANREQITEDRREYRKRNAESIKAQQAAWRDANREHLRAYSAEAFRKNPHRNDASSARWYRANPERVLLHTHRSRATREGVQVVMFTFDEFRARVAFLGQRCWVCGGTEDMTIDHVKPISKGGAHMLSNIRLACAPCNKRKSGTWLGAQSLDSLVALILTKRGVQAAYNSYGVGR